MAALIILTLPVAVLACSCMGMSTEELIDNPSLIFTGRVERVTVVPEPLPPEARTEPRYDQQLRTEFRVKTAWKGIVEGGQTVAIESRSNSAACGITFDVGETYLIAAYGTARRGYGTSSCGMAFPDNAEEAVADYWSRAQVFRRTLWSANYTGASNPQPFRNAITFFIEHGDYESALPLFDQALELVPDDADLRLLLARTYLQIGEPERALREFEYIDRVWPGNTTAGRGLRRTLLELRKLDDPRLRGDFSGLEQVGLRMADRDLSGASFRAASLADSDFSRANLDAADIREAYLRAATFTRASLAKARLDRADLTEADLAGSDLTGASLRNAKLRTANLTHARLRDADLTGADLSNAVLTGADLTNADLLGVNIAGADLQDADLSTAKLDYLQRSAGGSSGMPSAIYNCGTAWPDGFDPAVLGAQPADPACKVIVNSEAAADEPRDLRNIDLSRTDLGNMSFAGVDLSAADFSRAKLDGIDFTGAKMADASFRDAELFSCNFEAADLSGADFAGATIGAASKSFRRTLLDGADFGSATLSQLDFAGARLRNVNFHTARLKDVSFTAKDGAPDADLAGAKLQGAHLSRVSVSDSQLTTGDFRAATASCAWHALKLLAAMEKSGILILHEGELPCDHRDASSADLRGLDLRNTNFSGTRMRSADFRGADLRGANFGSDYSFEGIAQSLDLSRAQLDGARLRGARYDENTAWPKGFDVRSAGMVMARPGSALSEFGALICFPPANVDVFGLTDFPGLYVPSFPGEDLSGIDLTGAWLPGSDLRGTSLTRATLAGVNLSGALLEGAKLDGADLLRASLENANLTGASLRDADLSQANLRNAVLTDVDLTGVRYNDCTRWPAGFDPIDAGAGRRGY